MPTDPNKRARLRKFIATLIEYDLSQEGEHAIDQWEEYMERDDEYVGVYQLTEADKTEIKNIIREYRQTREQEDLEREQRRLAEERADEAMANHYADRIKKIVLSKPNKFLPKPKTKPTTRRKTH